MQLELILRHNLPVGLTHAAAGRTFADLPYRYEISWQQGDIRRRAGTPQGMDCVTEKDPRGGTATRIRGQLGEKIKFEQAFLQPADGSWLEETLTLTNRDFQPVRLEDWQFGFRHSLVASDRWRWIAVPFRVQVDGKMHDYGVDELAAGRYANSNDSMPWAEGVPPLGGCRPAAFRGLVAGVR